MSLFLGQICKLSEQVLWHQTHRLSILHDSGSPPFDQDTTFAPTLLSKLLPGLYIMNQIMQAAKKLINFSQFFWLL